MDDARDERYRNIPPMAGLCSIEDAAKPGLSVEECVRRLKRFHYAFKRLHEIFVARLTAEPVYELKTAFAHHAYLCSEHVAALRERVSEMREPPLGLDAVPDPNLEILFDEILAAPTTGDLLKGLYLVGVHALRMAMVQHTWATNPLADAPTMRVCRFADLELVDMLKFAVKAVDAIVPERSGGDKDPWIATLHECLAAAGGLDGAAPPFRQEYPARPLR